jgi:hypothetical protein
VNEEPELHVIKFSDLPGSDERRAQRERDGQESRRRYVEYLAAVLVGMDGSTTPTKQAEAILDALTLWRRIASEDECHCSCHPHLPTSDFHDYGFDCPCRHTTEERRRWWDAWMAENDEFWASDEGRRITAEREAKEAELAAWLGANPAVSVRSHGGIAPEQWTGTVDGHSFYFRERHDDWRIELDLRPSGRFSRVWLGGNLEDDDNLELRELDEGDVIADGTISAEGYGSSPMERIRFIVDVIRTHLIQKSCLVHTSMAGDLQTLFGVEVAWCPACGVRLPGPGSAARP